MDQRVKMFVVLGFLCIGLLNAASLADINNYDERCNPIMKQNGLTWRFPGSVAHGVHSLTLEDVRYYFKPTATENNNIPTVNYNLTDDAIVLPHAMLYGYDTTFQTIAMRHLDQVLKDMGNKNWYMANYNTLERLAHTIHMEEVWTKAKQHYNTFLSRPYNQQLCACVKDIHGNGVLNMLKFMALKIRYPGITSGRSGKERRRISKRGYRLVIEWPNKQLIDRVRRFNFDGRLGQVKRRTARGLVDRDVGIDHIDSVEHWLEWKALMKSMADHDSYELAMFLHCMLRD